MLIISQDNQSFSLFIRLKILNLKVKIQRLFSKTSENFILTVGEGQCWLLESAFPVVSDSSASFEVSRMSRASASERSLTGLIIISLMGGVFSW